MHRQILDPGKSEQIDHINRNGLDNRRGNLRVATPAQNVYNRGLQDNNTSGFMGVVWNQSCKKWQAQIKVASRLKYLGVFADKQDAANAYQSEKLSLKI